jgi:hypothetical protein
MPDPPEQPDFILRLRTVGADRCTVNELRRLLKALLRRDRLRCLSIVEIARAGEVTVRLIERPEEPKAVS